MTRTEAIAAIRAARDKAGLTQSEAAKSAEISQGTWANAESGARTVAPETIVRMAKAVGLRLRYEPEKFAVGR